MRGGSSGVAPNSTDAGWTISCTTSLWASWHAQEAQPGRENRGKFEAHKWGEYNARSQVEHALRDRAEVGELRTEHRAAGERLAEAERQAAQPVETSPPAADLDDRVAAAFGANVPSSDISALITEVEAAVAWAGDAAAKARGRALDPVLAASEVAAAHRKMEDAAFRGERLQSALTRLREQLPKARAEEEDHRRWVVYEKAKAERDNLAAELADIYPQFERQLADLLPRIDANDRQIERINTRLPDGAKHLHVAELVARGVGNFIVDGIHTVPRITKQLRLPAFTFDKFSPFTWPSRRDTAG